MSSVELPTNVQCQMARSGGRPTWLLHFEDFTLRLTAGQLVRWRTIQAQAVEQVRPPRLLPARLTRVGWERYLAQLLEGSAMHSDFIIWT